MNVHLYTWIITGVVLIGVLAADIAIIGRRPHLPSMKECATFVTVYVLAAILFGIGLWAVSGPQYGKEFFAGWLTEYSLSLDNLFIFLIIMERLRVPRHLQQFALMVGIVLALVFRGIFIAAGAAAIERAAWVFFLFGAFLLYTAFDLVRDYFATDVEEDVTENVLMRWVKRRFGSTEEWHGTSLTVVQAGKRVMTPMLIVIVALGSTDVLFALDSIPAIYGLTKEPFLVFTANVLALMGLRQLYFLLGGALKKLVYLSIGLAAILGFIGVRLVLQAMNHYHLDQEWLGINGEVSIELSLGVIVGTLIVTTVVSLLKSRRDAAETIRSSTH